MAFLHKNETCPQFATIMSVLAAQHAANTRHTHARTRKHARTHVHTQKHTPGNFYTCAIWWTFGGKTPIYVNIKRPREVHDP